MAGVYLVSSSSSLQFSPQIFLSSTYFTICSDKYDDELNGIQHHLSGKHFCIIMMWIFGINFMNEHDDRQFSAGRDEPQSDHIIIMRSSQLFCIRLVFKFQASFRLKFDQQLVLSMVRRWIWFVLRGTSSLLGKQQMDPTLFVLTWRRYSFQIVKRDCDDISGLYFCQDDPFYQDTSCPNYQFQCRDKTCISDILLCNGMKDCPGGEDESKCGCDTITMSAHWLWHLNCPGQLVLLQYRSFSSAPPGQSQTLSHTCLHLIQ